MNCSSKVLRRTLALLMLICLPPLTAMAQQMTVKGVVTDGQEPIIGATVKVKGEQGGAITDFDGNYSIRANKGQVLVFTYVGYREKEVTVTSSQHDVVLEEDNALLNEVVVVGYGTMRKSDLTGAVTQV